MMRIWGLRVADCRAVRIASSTFIAVSHIHNFMTRRDARSADVPGTTASGRKGQRSTGMPARRGFLGTTTTGRKGRRNLLYASVCSRSVGPFFVRERKEGTEHDSSVASRCVELLQAELDCIRWPGVSADFGPGGVS